MAFLLLFYLLIRISFALRSLRGGILLAEIWLKSVRRMLGGLKLQSAYHPQKVLKEYTLK